jgi:hypothetical protein
VAHDHHFGCHTALLQCTHGQLDVVGIVFDKQNEAVRPHQMISGARRVASAGRSEPIYDDSTGMPPVEIPDLPCPP